MMLSCGKPEKNRLNDTSVAYSLITIIVSDTISCLRLSNFMVVHFMLKHNHLSNVEELESSRHT